MNGHRYRVGQTVNFKPDRREQSARRGRYEIVRLLPAEGIDNQYRVRSVSDGHERVVRESQLG